jgi:hypothetical protein
LHTGVHSCYNISPWRGTTSEILFYYNLELFMNDGLVFYQAWKLRVLLIPMLDVPQVAKRNELFGTIQVFWGTGVVFMPILINIKKCASAQICTAFESYLAIFGQIAQKRCANAGRWTPGTYRASSVQHLYSGMLASIKVYVIFYTSHISGRCSFSEMSSQ